MNKGLETTSVVEEETIVESFEDKQYPVVELFSSVQGEGAFMGMPVTFLRLAGCNLRCVWCDTKESWKTEGITKMTVAEIVDKIDKNILVVTGGEPCLHDLTELIEVCHERNILVNIETNGTLPTPPNADWVTCSPKPPEYKIHEGCMFSELKYIVDDVFDPETCVPMNNPEILQGMVWLHPESHKLESAKRAFEYTMKYPKFRMGIQMHKVFDIK